MSAILAVIDTNVLVSALISRNPDSAAVKVISAVFERRIVPMLNAGIMEEYREVLARPKFKLPEDLVAAILGELLRLGTPANTTACDEAFPDTDDRVFYEVALSNDLAYLVTGNARHFPKTEKVVSPAAMLHILEMR